MMTSHKKPLVSVLIPVFNVAAYVKEALQSIQNQTYQNLEIIVIDDGSSDDTYSIVEELSKHDERVLLYKNDKNLKIVKTLNKALSLASGEYIARMDGDDSSELDRINVLLDFIEEHPEFDIVGTSMTAINDIGDKIFKSTYSSNPVYLKKTLPYNPPLAHIWIAKRKVYEHLNGYRELPGAEDYDFLLRAISSGFNLTNISEYYGYNVRVNRVGNTSNTMGIAQIKLHSYVWSMHKERCKKGSDSFSPYKVEKLMKASPTLNFLHTKSNRFLGAAVDNKGNVLKLAFNLLLSLISPYQIIYLKRRVSLHLLSKLIK